MTVVQKNDSMITAKNEDTIVARNSVFSKKLTQPMPTSTNFDTPPVNPLSQEGVVATPPPFRIFPHAVFAFLLGLPFGQFSYLLSRYPCIYEKKNQNILPWKKLCFFFRGEGGGGGVATASRPEREGLATKMDKFSWF